MNQILYSERAEKKSINKIVIVLTVLVVIIFGAISILSNQLDEKILANVYIGDIDVGMKTKEAAINLINPKLNSYVGAEVQLVLGEKSVSVTPDDIGFELQNDVYKMVDDAYDYGRNSNFFSNGINVFKSYFKDTIVEVNYKLDDKKLSKVFDDLSFENEKVSVDDTYEISGDKVFIYKGTDGLKIDEDSTKEYIITAFLNNISSVTIPTIEKESQKVDLESLYDEIYVAPQNASYVKGETFEVIVDKPGRYFDLTEIRKEYNNLPKNETLVIALKEARADVTVADLESELFSNVIATYSTVYDESDTDRVQNLKVAAERCNNTILYTGDEFSYNKALGTRTIANGFAPGHSFAGGRVVTTIGGGICQVSSTLYNVVLMADLDVTNRIAHGMYVEYVKPSLDATVVDGAIDFKFKNDRKYPVKIEASAKNGVVTVSILGLKDENEPIIEIESVVLETLEYKTIRENDSSMDKGTTKVVQEPVNGYVSEAYRIVKDKNGKEISRTLISKDRYIATNEIIKVGTKEEVVIVVPVEPEPEVVPEVTPTPVPEVNEDDDRLSPGWDSPENPYANMF